MHIDARVPVVFGAITDARPDDALLIEGDAPAPDGRVVVRLMADAQPRPDVFAACRARRRDQRWRGCSWRAGAATWRFSAG